MPNNKKTRDVLVEFTGDVFTLYVEAEGTEIDLKFNGTDTWSRRLKDFPVVGGLDFRCVAKGLAGTECTLTFTVDKKKHDPEKGETSRKGVWFVAGTINLDKNKVII